MDEASAKLHCRSGYLVEHSAVLDQMADAFPRGSIQWPTAQEVLAEWTRPTSWPRSTRLKTAFGTDIPIQSRTGPAPGRSTRHTGALVYARRSARHWQPGPTRNCWRCQESGALYAASSSVVKEGALADLLLVDGDPIADINLVADPAKNFVVIMKDGKIYKNSLPQ